MLQVKNITKQHRIGVQTQTVLNDVTLTFRDNEFVSILGPSGAGKTTLLNIIGGLDKYTSGDIIVDGISTKRYKDADWDSYRNQEIGFVFQNYNLISHQSVLANVELALTISGVPKKERTAAAKAALYQVGLTAHMHKKPNQLSGGQMQRVAIARALVNNPEIILADEPTGSLDSDTSIQIMNILKEISKDRLVIMVTHNKELAEKYSTRIIQLRDGVVESDSNPCDENVSNSRNKKWKKMEMSFKTAFNLSWSNLKTKKARTILTSFAASIGIIGIALIIAIANGVNNYIDSTQKDIMMAYPIQIQEESVNISSILDVLQTKSVDADRDLSKVYANSSSINLAANITDNITKNDLKNFKIWLSDNTNPIHRYIGINGVQYLYDMDYTIYSYDIDGELINDKTVVLGESENTIASIESAATLLGQITGKTDKVCGELLSDEDGHLSSAIKDNYELIAGVWPKGYNDVVIMVDSNNQISALSLYKLGLLPSENYIKTIEEGLDVNVQLDFEDFLNHKLVILTESSKYIKNEDGCFEYKGNTKEDIEYLMNLYGIQLNVSGIIRAKPECVLNYNYALGYSNALTQYIMQTINESNVIISQNNAPDLNVLTGYAFDAQTDLFKIDQAKQYFQNMSKAKKVQFAKESIVQMYGNTPQTAAYLAAMSEYDFLTVFEQQIETMTDADWLPLYDEYVPTGTYEGNMKTFGFVDEASPSEINIYVDSFENKQAVTAVIEEYNNSVDKALQITYTDYIGMILSSVTSVISSITYVLIAFVAISLLVSSIMIGIITNISVMERTKEIGILRAIGTPKLSIAYIFNAETFLVGFSAGCIGLIIARILQIPINNILQNIIGSSTVGISLPFGYAILLMFISILFTLIGGVIPSMRASRKDPVQALRNE